MRLPRNAGLVDRVIDREPDSLCGIIICKHIHPSQSDINPVGTGRQIHGCEGAADGAAYRRFPQLG